MLTGNDVIERKHESQQFHYLIYKNNNVKHLKKSWVLIFYKHFNSSLKIFNTNLHVFTNILVFDATGRDKRLNFMFVKCFM